MNIDFSLGKVTGIMGNSGSGKSTLLRIISGLLTAEQGTISLPDTQLGFVFQEPRLLPWLSIQENIELPLQVNSLADKSKLNIRAIASQLGIEQLLQHFPHQLSGGQKMRASLARALVTRPSLLLLDEPFAALDEPSRETLQNLIIKICEEEKQSMFFVSHSVTEAAFLFDDLLILDAQKQNANLHHLQPLDRTIDQDHRLSPQYLERQLIIRKLLKLGKS